MASQHEEDTIINKYFGNQDNGVYVDIGAGDPIKFSNTYALYQRGWRGLVIEPYHIYHEAWKKERPEDVLLPIAVMHYEGEAEMCITATVGSWVGNEYKEQNKGELYKVPCDTMNNILEKHGITNLDFVSIDIESNEDNLISHWDLDKYKPKVICIERQIRGIDQRDRWEGLLLKRYYLDAVTYTNAFYKRR